MAFSDSARRKGGNYNQGRRTFDEVQPKRTLNTQQRISLLCIIWCPENRIESFLSSREGLSMNIPGLFHLSGQLRTIGFVPIFRSSAQRLSDTKEKFVGEYGATEV